jgi:hypothetical protein
MVLLTGISQSDINGIVGLAMADSEDNTSAVLAVNLEVAPCEIDFKGNPPAAVQVVVANDGVSATGVVNHTTDGDILVITFSQPITPEGFGFDAVFEYASL